MATLLARQVMRPLNEVTRATSNLAAHPDRELPLLPVRSRNEVGQLTESFNKMTTELKRSHEEALSAAKFAFAGQLAAMVAHEVRTPLSVMRSSAQMLATPASSRTADNAELVETIVDEIGDMPLALQAKLLRVLEDATVEPLGTNKRVSVDVRVISATNHNLEEAIAGKSFRSELYYRLNTFVIHLLHLRERVADVDILAPLFLDRSARNIGKGPIRLSDDALALLRSYDWPGNVRELRNLMERAAVLSTEGVVTDRFLRSMLQVAHAPAQPEARNPCEEPSDYEATLPLGDAVERFASRSNRDSDGER